MEELNRHPDTAEVSTSNDAPEEYEPPEEALEQDDAELDSDFQEPEVTEEDEDEDADEDVDSQELEAPAPEEPLEEESVDAISEDPQPLTEVQDEPLEEEPDISNEEPLTEVSDEAPLTEPEEAPVTEEPLTENLQDPDAQELPPPQEPENTTEPVSQSPDSLEDRELQEPAATEAQPVPDGEERSAQDRMGDYLSEHNYGPDDYAEYSKDPEWQQLNNDLREELGMEPIDYNRTPEEKLQDYLSEHNYGQEDYDQYSQDPEWRDLQREAFPDAELPPLNRPDNLGPWKDMTSDTPFSERLEGTNPNYDAGDEWKVNCQRCVPTYEMRARGYDVTAQPCTESNDYLSYHPYDVWQNPDVHTTSGNGKSDIESAMQNWGDGARAQVCVAWDKGDGGHTFMAEQRDGVTHFFDPQTGEENADWYFDEVRDGSVSFCRTDDLMPSSRILNCCKEAE